MIEGGRVCDVLLSKVTVVHDAFRPSVQSAQGSHQVQLEVWRAEQGAKAEGGARERRLSV